jgi:tetratricopeptide (TPR) repeat protein
LSDDALSPGDYKLLLKQVEARLAEDELALSQAEDQYKALADSVTEAETRARTLEAQAAEIKARGGNPDVVEDAERRSLAAASEVVGLAAERQAAFEEAQRAYWKLNDQTNRDSMWRNLENPNRRWYDAQQRYLEADRAFNEYRRAHPDACYGEPGLMDLFNRRMAADDAVSQARREFNRAYFDSPDVRKNWRANPGNKTQPLQPPAPADATPSLQSTPSAQSGQTLPLLPGVAGQSGQTVPLQPPPAAQSGRTLPLLPTPQSRALTGQLGVADALSTAK